MVATPLQQSIELARAERIGAEGIAAADFGRVLARTQAALDILRAREVDGSLPLLRLPSNRHDLGAIIEIARRLTVDTTDIVFLGTGGSSLGGQTLAQLAGYGIAGAALRHDGPRLHFMDNLDPTTFAALLTNLPLASTRFVAVSKSGGTGETLMQTASVITAYKSAGLGGHISEHLLGLTEPARSAKRNGLRELLSAHAVPMIDHDPGIGGRFSVLSNVGLMPAAVAGLDIAAVRAGAASALAPVLEAKRPEDVPAAVGAALAVALAETKAKTISVLMAYSDRLERLTHWYVQLWAESLGKDSKGTTPLAALGPVDQHSQLQLFIGGPRDKLFTVITLGIAGSGPRIAEDLAALAGEPEFAGRTFGDLVAAQGQATAETLAKNGCPVRTIHIDTLDETSLGALLMQYMLETIIAAHLFDVDAFDQPAVEEGKVLAKKYLAGN